MQLHWVSTRLLWPRIHVILTVIWYLLRIVLECLLFDVWPSGPEVSTNWHFVFTLRWFAKLLPLKKNPIYPVIPKERLAFLLQLSIFFRTLRADDSRVFQFSDAIVLVSHFSAVKMVCWCISTLTKWNINWSVLKLQIILYFEKLWQFSYSWGMEPMQVWQVS